MSMEWPVRPEWLALVREPIFDPELPIVDAHHHLWKLPHETYLLPEFLADIGAPGEGHHVVATVFAECGAMYRPQGPAELRSLGEVEFANGIAAQAASGVFGDVGVCAAITGSVDLALGRRAGEVMDIHAARAPERSGSRDSPARRPRREEWVPSNSAAVRPAWRRAAGPPAG